ncbi:uncharacterized protein CMC5_028680 [Chondromyces crocatus]|uniref:Uncharacterized protein n=1 Tax=Chondromyces crocatus TaxID=52 RepID=A0A0K1ED01_CHOCO|nr:uncharacterized protein CMC5_028680 [Chondromyces crocatus]
MTAPLRDWVVAYINVTRLSVNASCIRVLVKEPS